jgi:hypothetical protein
LILQKVQDVLEKGEERRAKICTLDGIFPLIQYFLVSVELNNET